jgi:hypothetical protein
MSISLGIYVRPILIRRQHSRARISVASTEEHQRLLADNNQITVHADSGVPRRDLSCHR